MRLILHEYHHEDTAISELAFEIWVTNLKWEQTYTPGVAKLRTGKTYTKM